ncbi:MAG: hypothetical protein ACRD9L_27705, partial [Bryobacteraceae bacterium]
MKILVPLLCVAAAALAQEGTRINVPETPSGPGNTIAVAGPIGFFGVEAALDEKVVTGAPYSADAVT